MEILKGGGNNPTKRAWRFAKKRLGTHIRAKRKVGEMDRVIAEVKKQESQAKAAAGTDRRTRTDRWSGSRNRRMRRHGEWRRRACAIRNPPMPSRTAPLAALAARIGRRALHFPLLIRSRLFVLLCLLFSCCQGQVNVLRLLRPLPPPFCASPCTARPLCTAATGEQRPPTETTHTEKRQPCISHMAIETMITVLCELLFSAVRRPFDFRCASRPCSLAKSIGRPDRVCVRRGY